MKKALVVVGIVALLMVLGYVGYMAYVLYGPNAQTEAIVEQDDVEVAAEEVVEETAE
jgi:hypothetical protein